MQIDSNRIERDAENENRVKTECATTEREKGNWGEISEWKKSYSHWIEVEYSCITNHI